MYNYLNDKYARICLDLAKQCKTGVGFGAVLEKNGILIGEGRNRLATAMDRLLIPYVDYAIHAEQDAILSAILKGYDVRDSYVYVLGLCLRGQNKGKLTTRTEDVYVCSKCPHVFMKYNIGVFIPHVEGWHLIEPHRALEIGKQLANKGYWKDFVERVAV